VAFGVRRKKGRQSRGDSWIGVTGKCGSCVVAASTSRKNGGGKKDDLYSLTQRRGCLGARHGEQYSDGTRKFLRLIVWESPRGRGRDDIVQGGEWEAIWMSGPVSRVRERGGAP